MHYLEFLREAHRQIQPRLYVEIGVRIGRSLALSRAKTYGIDPAFAIKEELNAWVRLFRTTSDEFFQRSDLVELFQEPADMAFIDGMHHFEFALRDFANVERVASKRAIVFFDDVFPRKPEWATREKTGGAWTGDVWKILPCLNDYRKDLAVLPINVRPSGLLMVCNLDPDSRTLVSRYQEILEEFSSSSYNEVPQYVLNREGILEPESLLTSGLLKTVASSETENIKAAVRNWEAGVRRMSPPGRSDKVVA
jgi:hypothetical protein